MTAMATGGNPATTWATLLQDSGLTWRDGRLKVCGFSPIYVALKPLVSSVSPQTLPASSNSYVVSQSTISKLAFRMVLFKVLRT
jgi:hypothetical protein